MKTRNSLPYAALGALAVLLFAPFFASGRVLWSQDIGRVYYPVAHLLGEALRTRDLARVLWCPELGAGFPLVADGVTTPFYPPHWPLLVLLHPAEALTAALFVAYLGSALAMAAFARTLGLRRAAATVAGLVYAWSGFAVGHSVHVNVVAGLPYLPLVLLFLEKASRHAPLRNVALAGVCFGLQCLGGHPQVALMSAALGSAYALFRLWPARTTKESLVRPLGLVALFGAIGAGISAVYYLPMAELARQSVRPEGGLTHAQAVAYSLPFPHLLTALSPFLFFDAATGDYGGAWNPAEMAFYAGLPTLLLAGAALWSRPRDPLVRFFAAVVATGLLLALGDGTPLHGILHSLPVFRGLRAPARYVLLVDAALAVLAARGLESLREGGIARPRRRLVVVLAGAAFLVCGLPFAERLWRGRLAGDGWHDAEWVRGPAAFFAGKDWLPLLWLALAALWLWRKPRAPATWWPAAGVALVAADLFAFAATSFATHWVQPEVVLRTDPAHALAASPGPGHERAYIVSGPEPWRSASDLPLVYGFRSLNAYVSLPLARHAAYLRAFWLSDQTAGGLLDAAAVTSVVDSWRRPLDPRSTLGGVEFSPRFPLASLEPGNRVDFDLQGAVASGLQLVTALEQSADVPQDTEVARVTVEAPPTPPMAFHLRAGVETAQRLHDERTAHSQPALRIDGWSLVDRRSEGFFYLSRFAWPGVPSLRSVGIEYTGSTGRLLLFGAATVDSTGAVNYVTPFMRDGYRRVVAREGALLYEKEPRRPRAHAVHRVVHVSTAEEAVGRLATGEVHVEDAVVLEDGAAPTPAGHGPSEASIEHDGPLRVDVRADMQGDGYVVLADTFYPGWRATVDGAPTPVYAANGNFRAVFVKDGSHRVAFEYRPRALHVGLVVTLISLALSVLLSIGGGRTATSNRAESGPSHQRG